MIFNVSRLLENVLMAFVQFRITMFVLLDIRIWALILVHTGIKNPMKASMSCFCFLEKPENSRLFLPSKCSDPNRWGFIDLIQYFPVLR